MADTQQNAGLFASSDYKLSTLVIVTSTGLSLDIKNQMLELNLFEDLFSPVMTGSVRVGESGDIISNLQLHGNEYILIEVDKPSLEKPIVKVFRIYKISDRDFGTASLQNYTIHFCSEELMLSNQLMMSKSYKGLPISSMVKDILVNKLKVNPAKMANGTFEVTNGNFDLIVPRLQPLEAIQWMTPKAYSTVGDLFFFFENRDGFNFASYETLISQPVYATYSRDVKANTDPAQNYLSFNYAKVIEDFDVLKSTRYGAYGATMLALDLVNRNFSTKTFGYKNLTDADLLNDQAPFNQSKNRLGMALTDAPEAILRYSVNSDVDPTANPSLIGKWMPQTISRIAQIHTFKMMMTIPGDVMVKVGQVLTVIVPQMTPQTKQVENDDMRSGNFLVSAVHHKFNQDIYTTIIELLSDSVNTELTAAASDSSLEKIKQS